MPAELPRPPRPSRNEPREIAELRHLKELQPDLATAIDLQIEITALQYRVQSRVPMPWLEVDAAWLRQQHAEGRPLLRFEDLPIDWTDVRLMVRQTAEILRRFDTLDPAEHDKIQALARLEHQLEPVVVRWFNEKAAPDRVAAEASQAAVDTAAPSPARPEAPPAAAPAQPPHPAPRRHGAPSVPADPVDPEALDQVLTLAMRPFLARCAEAFQQRADLSTWTHAHCPLCGGAAELAVITKAADRLLICGRCTARWKFDPLACPTCGNADRAAITSFTSRDGQYRIYACERCLHYLKAFDARSSDRPVMLSVDAIATLPLDAAAMQKGYKP